MILVWKRIGEPRLIIDYKCLNLQTIKDKFPLPVIDDLLNYSGGYKMYAMLDATLSFLQLPMHPDSVLKTVFTTLDGYFEHY